METTAASAPTSPFATAEGLNRILLALFGISDKISDIIFSPGKPPQVELNIDDIAGLEDD